MSSGLETTFPRQYAATRRFTLGTPRNIQISADGHRVLFLRSKAGDDPVLCLWELTIATGVERLVVDPNDMADLDADLPAAERARRERAREGAAGIVSYSLDDEATTAAFALGGSLFSVELAAGTLRSHATDAGVFDPRIDPSGRRIAFMIGSDLHLVELDGTNSSVLATDDDPLVSWGRADFIAAEEMGRSRGFWWAPDGQSLIACRVCESSVQRWWIADPANPGVAPAEIRYPAAGTANAEIGLALIQLDGQRTEIRWHSPVPDVDPFEYLNDVVWSEGHDPLVVRQTRDQRTVSIAAVSTAAASQMAVVEQRRITDDVWVELLPGSPSWSALGLLTLEDRADLDRRVLCLDGRPISPDDIHVRSIAAVCGTTAVVTAWTDSTEIHVWAIDLEDESRSRRLTSDAGVHNVVAAAAVAVITSTSLEQSATRFVVRALGQDLGDGAPLPDLVAIQNHAATPVISTAPEMLRLGKRLLAAALFLPTGHDGRSPLPVLLDPYGGPHAQRVVRSHLPHLTSQWFADQGFAVLVVDNRGTPGRGPSFERAVWGDLAGPVLEDQLDALDAASEKYPFLDLERVGIRGWSFGGYLATLAALRAPDRIHAAIAGAPVTTWHLYDTHYTERYLGHPDDYPSHYANNDLTAEAASLQRPLLLIHGLADDNVVAAHTLRMSSALLAAGRSHHVLPLSGVTHMTPQEIVAENMLHLQRDFLLEHLGSVPPGR